MFLGALFLALSATSAEPRCATVFEAAEAALDQSPRVDQAAAAEGIARAQLSAARAQGRPQISLFAQTGIGEAQPLDQSRDDQVGVSAQWELFTFGERAAANAAAREAYLASRYGTREAAAEAAQQALLLALELDRAERVLKLATLQASGYSEEAASAERRLEKGLLTISDARQIQARYDAAIARREEAAVARDLVAAELGVVAQRPIFCIDEHSTNKLSELLDQRLSGVSPDEALAYAEDFAGSVRQAEAELRASKKRVKEAQRRGLPSVSLNAFFLSEYNDSTLPVNDRWTEDDRVGFTLRQEIYGGGQLKAQRAETQFRYRDARANLGLQRQSLEIIVRRAALSSIRQDAIYARRAAAASSALDRFEATKRELDLGTKTITDFVLANEDYYSAAIDAVTAQFTRDQERVRLATLTGAIIDLRLGDSVR